MKTTLIFFCVIPHILLQIGTLVHATSVPPPDFDRVIIVKVSSGSFDSTLGWTQSLYPGQVNTIPGNQVSYGTDDGFDVNTFSLSPECDFKSNDYDSALYNNEEIPISQLQTMYDDGACDGYGYGHTSTDIIPNLGYYEACALPATAFLANNYMVVDDYYGCYLSGPYSNRICGISGSTDRFTDIVEGSNDNVEVPGPNFMFSPCNMTTVFDYADEANVSSAYYYVGDLPFLSIFSETVGGGQIFKYGSKIRKQQNFLGDIKGTSPSDVSSFPSITYVDLAFNFSVKDNVLNSNTPEDILKREFLIYQTLWSIRLSPMWNKTIVLIVPDHSGGYFDHAQPFPVDDTYASSFDWEGISSVSGFRLPAIIMSPFARHKIATGGPYDHSSVLNMISDRWNLSIPSYRNVSSLLKAFDSSLPHLRKVTFDQQPDLFDETPVDDDLAWLVRIIPKGCGDDYRGTIHIDACGVCGGQGASCKGCDGKPYSGKVFDSCGVCGGNHASCSLSSNTTDTSPSIHITTTCPFLDASMLSKSPTESSDMLQKMQDSVKNGCVPLSFINSLLGLPAIDDFIQTWTKPQDIKGNTRIVQIQDKSDTKPTPIKSKLQTQMQYIKDTQKSKP